jgi:hypothetical protein
MSGELIQVVAWGAALLCHVVAADHLRRRLGVIVASQSVLMAFGALVAASLMHAGAHVSVALGGAAIASAIIAMLHVAVLRFVGYELLLVSTVALHFIFVEAWLALSEWTGGSGGRFVAFHRGTAIAILVVTATGVAVASRYASRTSLRFPWEITKSLGLNGGVMGVPSVPLFHISFAGAGLSAGLCGAAIMLLSGFLSIASFPLVWPLVALSVALVARRLRMQATLCILYAVMHVALRTLTAPTSLISHGWEIAFPLVLLALAVYRRLRPVETRTGVVVA